MGLGGMVRGSESGNYDAPFKAVNCLDIRLNLPALFGLDITPTLLVFFDAGYYRSTGEGGDGFLFSTGGGLYVDVLNMATIGVSTRLLLNRSRVGQPNGWEAISLEYLSSVASPTFSAPRATANGDLVMDRGTLHLLP